VVKKRLLLIYLLSIVLLYVFRNKFFIINRADVGWNDIHANPSVSLMAQTGVRKNTTGRQNGKERGRLSG
jgi:hypothetical protein